MKLNFTFILSLVLFAFLSANIINASAQTVNAVATNSACPDEGKIDVTTTGFTGVIGYQLKKDGVIVRPLGGSGFQTSNVFENLPAGTYDVIANDGIANATSAPVTVTISYTRVVASVAPGTVNCGSSTASLSVVTTGGSGSFLYAMTPTTETNAPPASNFQVSNTFNGLAVGSYKFWVKDITCASAILVNTTGAVNNVPSPDANVFSLNVAAALGFLVANDHTSGYRISVERFFRGNYLYMTAAEAASFTLEVMDGSTSVAGPINVSPTGNTNIPVPAGLVNHTLTLILKNTCTGNTKTFAISQLGPGMHLLATCPEPQAMYRMLSYSLVSLPATITYTNQNGTTEGNRTIVRNSANDRYNYINFPPNSKFDWKVVDASGAEWNGAHDFTNDLVTRPSQWTSYINNCKLREGSIELIMTGIRNSTPLKYEILEAPAEVPELVGYIGDMAAGWKNDFQLQLNKQMYFPKGRYRIRFIDAGCYNGETMYVTAQGNEATVTEVAKTGNCGSFNFKINGTFGTGFEQVVVAGPAGTVGLVKGSTETFTNMPYGTYTVGLRIRNQTCNIYTDTFTYNAESSIDFDAINSGGFTCLVGGTGDLVIASSTTIPGATLEYSIDNGVNWQTSNVFKNLVEGNYAVLIKESGCGNQRTVSVSVLSNVQATINNQPLTTTLCEGSNTVLNINAIGGTKYIWTYPDGSIHLGKVQNLTNISSANAGLYSIVVETGSCVTPPQTVSLKVISKPTVTPVGAQQACNGVVKSIAFGGTSAKEYTSASSSADVTTTYIWTNDNPAIGLPAAGTGNISFTPTNTGLTPLVANVTVIAQGPSGCSANSMTFSITVQPDSKLVLSTATGTNAQEKCLNEAITNISYAATNATGVTVTGLPAGLTGSYNAGIFTISGAATEVGTFNYTVTAVGSCASALATGTIKINPNVQLTLTSTANTATQAVNINKPITDVVYTITNGATGATITGLPAGVTGVFNAGIFTISGTPSVAGTFNYTISTVGGCGVVAASGQITVNANATITLSSVVGTDKQVICVNTPLVDINYSITNGTNATVTGLPAGVIGNFTAGSFKIAGTPTQSGTFNYTITVTGLGASATANGTITVTPNATITLNSATGTNTQSKCVSTAITNISYAVTNATGATVTGLPAGVTGVFSVDVFVISGTPTVSGTFNYTITVTGGCLPATATGSIIVNPNAAISLSSATITGQQSICVNSAIANISYAATNATAVTVAGLPSGVTGSYSNGVFTIKGSPNTTGVFNYTVTATSNCASAVTTGRITVNELPVASVSSSLGTTISKGDVAVITATGGTSYAWTGADIQNGNTTSTITVRPKQTTTYIVTVTNATGCTSEKSLTVNVTEDLKLIPNNIITPNGDGKNDFWVIKNIDYYPNNKVSVFDRAGRKVYASSGYKNDWDGSYAGAALAEAAYFYVIDMGNGYGLIRGTINIIRDKR